MMVTKMNLFSVFPVLSLLVTLLLVNSATSSVCEIPDLILPCRCADAENNLLCHSARSINLKGSFTQLVSMHHLRTNSRVEKFKALTIRGYFENKAIMEEVEMGTFAGFQFKEITIIQTTLKRIHYDAFPSSLETTNSINLSYNQLTNSPSSYHHSDMGLMGPDGASHERQEDDAFNVFRFIRRFPNLWDLNLSNNLLQSLPNDALSGLGQLQSLKLGSNHIKTLGPYALQPLTSLTIVDISYNKLKSLSPHGLHFGVNPALDFDLLDLDLMGNLLSDDDLSFLGHTTRPLNLNLSHNNMTLLKESIYDPLFRQYANSLVTLNENPIECGCDIKWLLNNKSYYEWRFKNLKCSFGKQLWDLNSSEYTNCM